LKQSVRGKEKKRGLKKKRNLFLCFYPEKRKRGGGGGDNPRVLTRTPQKGKKGEGKTHRLRGRRKEEEGSFVLSLRHIGKKGKKKGRSKHEHPPFKRKKGEKKKKESKT